MVKRTNKISLKVFIAILAVSLLLCGVAIGSYLSTHQVNNTVTVQGNGDVIIATHASYLAYLSSGNPSSLVPVTSISWGSFDASQLKLSNDTDIMDDGINIVNTRNHAVYVTWSVTGLPSGFTLKLYAMTHHGSSYELAPSFTFYLNAGQAWIYNLAYGVYPIFFTLQNINALLGSYSFTITFTATA